MKKKLILVIVAVLIIASAALFLKSKEMRLAALPKPQTPPPSVQVAPVTQGILEVTSHYLATIEPFNKSDLSPRITGAILSITKREGDFVRAGESLVVIDDRELQDRAVAVNADLLATRQKLAGAESGYATQKSVYSRDETLFKAGAISKEALERSQATLDGAKAVVDAYQENLKGQAMNTSMARTQAGYARITAPFSGVVSKRWAEPGDLAAPGKAILTVEKTSSYKILAQVPQEELAGIRPGSSVKLTNGSQTMPTKVNQDLSGTREKYACNGGGAVQYSAICPPLLRHGRLRYRHQKGGGIDRPCPGGRQNRSGCLCLSDQGWNRADRPG
jgi:RND family efflux transporter MFP subunit